MTELESLLSEDQLAEIIGKPARTLRQWRYTGVGPKYLKIGATVRYRPSDVEAWLDSRVQEPGMDRGTHP
jgi:predicted DNA-binding transcriptional regulator AlpA